MKNRHLFLFFLLILPLCAAAQEQVLRQTIRRPIDSITIGGCSHVVIVQGPDNSVRITVPEGKGAPQNIVTVNHSHLRIGEEADKYPVTIEVPYDKLYVLLHDKSMVEMRAAAGVGFADTLRYDTLVVRAFELSCVNIESYVRVDSLYEMEAFDKSQIHYFHTDSWHKHSSHSKGKLYCHYYEHPSDSSVGLSDFPVRRRYDWKQRLGVEMSVGFGLSGIALMSDPSSNYLMAMNFIAGERVNFDLVQTLSWSFGIGMGVYTRAENVNEKYIDYNYQTGRYGEIADFGSRICNPTLDVAAKPTNTTFTTAGFAIPLYARYFFKKGAPYGRFLQFDVMPLFGRSSITQQVTLDNGGLIGKSSYFAIDHLLTDCIVRLSYGKELWKVFVEVPLGSYLHIGAPAFDSRTPASTIGWSIVLM